MIFNDIEVQVIFVGIGEENISYSTISYGWAENRYVIFVAPVINALLIVDFFPQAVDKLSRCPSNIVLYLLLIHFCIERHQKFLKFDVVVVRNQNIPNSAMSIQPILNIIHVEFSQMESSQAFHDVFFYTSACSNNTVDHFMLGQVANDLSHPTGGHVRSIPQKDGASNFRSICRVTGFFIISLVQRFIRKSPSDHLIHNFNCSVQVSGLKSHSCKTFEEILVVNSLVKVIPFDNSRLQGFAFKEHVLNLFLYCLRGDNF